MLVNLTSKTQADKFFEQGWFEVRGESAYIDVWHDTSLPKGVVLTVSSLDIKEKVTPDPDFVVIVQL